MTLALISIISPTFAVFSSQEEVITEIQADTWAVPWSQTGVTITEPFEILACVGELTEGEQLEAEIIVHNAGPYDAFPLSTLGSFPEIKDVKNPIPVGGTSSFTASLRDGFNEISVTDGKTEYHTAVTVTCPEPENAACSPALPDAAITENQPAAASEGGAGDDSACTSLEISPDVIGGTEGNPGDATTVPPKDETEENKGKEETPEDGAQAGKQEDGEGSETKDSTPADNPIDPAPPAATEQPSEPIQEPAGLSPEPTAVKEGE